MDLALHFSASSLTVSLFFFFLTRLQRDNGGWDGWHLIRISTKEKNTFVITLCFKNKLFHNQVSDSPRPWQTSLYPGLKVFARYSSLPFLPFRLASLASLPFSSLSVSPFSPISLVTFLFCRAIGFSSFPVSGGDESPY